MGGTTRITCGTFGGRNQRGEPCGIASVDGPCARHRTEVETATALVVAEKRAEVTEILNPDFGFKVPPFTRLKDKVAIVGFTSHRIEALKLDDSWELWGLNELYRYMPPERFHRWFEIHDRELLCKDEDGQKHFEDMKTLLGDMPIYMHHKHDDIPGSVKFPMEEMCRQLKSEYWTNCPAEMIGLAILMGYKSIRMFGVDMATDTEYGQQRPCCEYWLGVAMGRGIEIEVPEQSDLLKCVGVYGYESEGTALTRKLTDRLAWLHEQDNDRLASIRQIEGMYQTQHAELTSRSNRYEGAIEELLKGRKTERRGDRLAAVRAELESTVETLGKLDAEYTQKHTALVADRNQILGGIQNTDYMLRSWMVKSSLLTGGNIPSLETRRSDPALGELIPSGDSVATDPAGVYTQA